MEIVEKVKKKFKVGSRVLISPADGGPSKGKIVSLQGNLAVVELPVGQNLTLIDWKPLCGKSRFCFLTMKKAIHTDRLILL